MAHDHRQGIFLFFGDAMMNPVDTYKMMLATMTHEELVEYTAILLRSLDKLGIEVLNDDIGDTETGE